MTPQGSKLHDDCQCPRCAPREWLVSDLVGEIRDRDDVLDVLVEAAKNALIYRDSDHHREQLRQALVAIDNIERIPS